MKRGNLKSDKHSDRVKTIVSVIGLITIMVYMLISIRNIGQIVLNFNLISANSGLTSIVFNIALYLVVIVTGFEAVRKTKSPHYSIIALVAILIIY